MKITRRSRYLDRCLPELLTRWEQEHVLEAAQRLDKTPDTMRTRREAVQHPFSDMKMRMGVTHLLTKTLPKVTPEIAPCASSPTSHWPSPSRLTALTGPTARPSLATMEVRCG
jgi:hypothetical protein